MDTQITTSLREVADQLQVPTPDLPALVSAARSKARRDRRLRAAYGVGVVAAVALVIIGSVSVVRAGDSAQPAHHGPVNHPTNPVRHTPRSQQPPTGTPANLAGLPRGAPPALPYWSHGFLRWSGHSRAMPYPNLVTGGGITLASWSGADGIRIWRVGGSGASPLARLTLHASAWPAISNDGHFASWETALGGHRSNLVLWDLTTNRLAAELPFTSHARCCAAPSVVVGIDALQRVYVDDGGTPLVWDHRHNALDVVQIPECLFGLEGARPQGPVVTGSGNCQAQGASSYGRLVAGQAFQPQGQLPSQAVAWSADGRLAAYVPADKASYLGLFVRNVETGHTQEMRLPPSIEVTQAVWESPTAVLVTTTRSNGNLYWLRCPTSVRGCERAADLGRQGGAGVVVPQ